MNKASLVSLLLLTSLVACDDDSDGAGDTAGDTDTAGDASGGDASVDEAAIIEEAMAYEMLTQVNDEPLESVHGLAATMNLFVDAGAASLYPVIPAGTVFDEDTIIVKEQLNGDGSLNSLAVMYKGPAGYSADSGDWWFAVVNPDGSTQVSGQPGACVGCHMDAGETDWAFGMAE